MLRYLGKNLGSETAMESYKSQLRSPAARQMLIHQTWEVTSSGPQYNQNISNLEPFRLMWRNTLALTGFPNNLRKVALVNGSWTGGRYNSDIDGFFTLQGITNTSFIEFMRAIPNVMGTDYKRICKVWKLGGLGLSLIYNLNAKTNLPFGSLDGCPGGMYDIQEEFHKQAHLKDVNPPWPLGFGKTYVVDMTHNTCFIPTPSALALNNADFDWGNSLDLNDILCNNKTPFDNYLCAGF